MDRLDDEYKELRGEVREGFAKVDERFEKVDERFEKVQEEFKSVRLEMYAGFERMQRTLIGGAFAVIVALITAPHL